MEILQVKNLTFSYAGMSEPILHDISFSIRDGEFTIICGKTGCGKTTLLRMLKRELLPFGKQEGAVYYKGTDLRKLSPRESAGDIGYVMQKPEQQIVTDKVWHELAFGLENLGVPKEKIRRRVCEMASYFGISQWFYQDVWELSGGQKQLLNLASVMAMNPKVLLLDEPVSQLDPIAAAEFLDTLKKLNREFGLTIIMIEHRLEEIFPDADKIIMLDKGKIFAAGAPYEVLSKIQKQSDFMEAMPAAARFYYRFFTEGQTKEKCPLTIREGKEYIEQHFADDIKELDDTREDYEKGRNKVLEFKEVNFRYEKDGRDILFHTTFQVLEHEIFCILGGNGSGKTTCLKAASGLIKPYQGKIILFNKKIQAYKNGALYENVLACLPQEVQNVFTKDSILEDFLGAYGCRTREELLEKLRENPILDGGMTELEPILERHPYDLSGGQQQICALIKVLCQKPKLLLLDEPTKGMDAYAKKRMSLILKRLRKTMSIVVVTHDIEFAAQTADRCGLFFHGEMISNDQPEKFFSENTFYTTAANRMTRSRYKNIVTIEDAEAICRKNGWSYKS